MQKHILKWERKKKRKLCLKYKWCTQEIQHQQQQQKTFCTIFILLIIINSHYHEKCLRFVFCIIFYVFCICKQKTDCHFLQPWHICLQKVIKSGCHKKKQQQQQRELSINPLSRILLAFHYAWWWIWIYVHGSCVQKVAKFIH